MLRDFPDWIFLLKISLKIQLNITLTRTRYSNILTFRTFER